MKRGGFLTETDRERLDRFPTEIDIEAIRKFFTIGGSDRDDVISRRYRSAGRLAGGLQIGAMRFLGFVPADLGSAPIDVIRYVAAQVDALPSDLADYSTRAKTRHGHVEAVERHCGYRRASPGDLKALADWLLERALEHDKPMVLFRLVCEHLQTDGVVRPGLTTLERAVVTARLQAIEETYFRIGPQLDTDDRDRLNQLLVVDADLGLTPWVWLRRQAPTAAPPSIKEQLAKIELLRSVGADRLDLSGLNPNRVRHLAAVGRRMTPQAVDRLSVARRYQLMAAAVVEELISRTDEVLELFDMAMANLERNARSAHDDRLDTNRAAAIETTSVFNQIAEIILDPTVSDDRVRSAILATVGAGRFRDLADRAAEVTVATSGDYLDLLIARYSQLRKFAPAVLAGFTFEAAEHDNDLLAAVECLQQLNLDRKRTVPDDAPTGFISRRWSGHVHGPDGNLDRHGWETCVVSELRGALRGANIWVDHSRRYRNPLEYLLPDDAWARLKLDYPGTTGIPLDPHERLAQLSTDLNDHITALDTELGATDTVRIEDGRLVVPQLPAEDDDSELDALKDRIDQLLPRIDLVDLLVEVDSWCGFLDQLTHADNATTRAANHRQRLLAAIMAHGCNYGIDTMARIAGFSPDQLAWTNTWHLRTDTIRAANDHIVNHQIGLPLAQHWGTGTLSSSDGQRFPVTVRTPTARRMRRYFTGTGATIYTWTSDRHAQYGTRVIPTTIREATHVLDAIFDNETDLEIEEHTTDTASYTDLVYGLFDLCGLRFSPRLADLAGQRLWRLDTTTTNTPAARLLQHNIRPQRFINRWDDMCRVAATIRHGYLPASTLVARLQGSARQNKLTQAIQEYGRIPKTTSVLRWLHNTEHRRRIDNQLNKGESIHGLRRYLLLANQGQLRRRDTGDQQLQGECLTLLTNAIICWNTVYIGAALDHLTATGHTIDPDHKRRLSPTVRDHVNPYGRYDFTNTNPPETGLRPLRTT